MWLKKLRPVYCNNIAHSILEPLLRGNYDDINAICAEVQSALDAKKGIGLKPQKAAFPAERVRAAIGRRGKKWVDSAERAERIKYAENQKPRRLSREQGQKLQADNAPKRLTGGVESGIILSDNNIPRLEAANPFKNPSTPLIIDDIMQSKHIKKRQAI